VASTIIGATSVDQLREDIDALTVTLPDGLVAAINAIHAELTNPAQ
jgi:aryl-alcohol dehydrogenase-like predicted oxidoreductase